MKHTGYFWPTVGGFVTNCGCAKWSFNHGYWVLKMQNELLSLLSCSLVKSKYLSIYFPARHWLLWLPSSWLLGYRGTDSEVHSEITVRPDCKHMSVALLRILFVVLITFSLIKTTNCTVPLQNQQEGYSVTAEWSDLLSAAPQSQLFSGLQCSLFDHSLLCLYPMLVFVSTHGVDVISALVISYSTVAAG